MIPCVFGVKKLIKFGASREANLYFDINLEQMF